MRFEPLTSSSGSNSERTPAAVQLQAELHFRWGHSDRVEQLLSSIDLDRADPGEHAAIVRRRAANLFLAKWDYEQALELARARVETVGKQ